MVQDIVFAAKVAAASAAATFSLIAAFAAISASLDLEARAECARLQSEAARWEDQVLPAWCEELPPQ